MNKTQLREMISELLDEAQWGAFTGGAAPLDEPPLDSGPMSPEQQQKVFDILVDTGSDPEELKASGDYPDVVEENIINIKNIIREELQAVVTEGMLDEKLNEGIMNDIQATWDSLNIPGPLVALLDKTEPMNKKVNDWFEKNMGNPVVRMLYKILMSTDFGATPDMYRLDKKFEKGELNEDGHTDVASARRQLALAIEDSKQMLDALANLPGEGDLPSWWMKKVALSSAYLNGARDYLLTSGEAMNEES